MPKTAKCPACGKRTQEAELVKVITETAFPKPYEVSYSTPLLKLALNAEAQAGSDSEVVIRFNALLAGGCSRRRSTK